MKNLQNALLLKQLTLLKQFGYRYTDEEMATRDMMWLDLPDNFDGLENVCRSCNLCQFSKSRKDVVFGHGNHRADIMFVGFAPNSDEDANADIYSSVQGQMLTKMIEGVLELNRDDIYYTNAIKCLPLKSIDKYDKEVAQCSPYLEKEIELISPRLIVCLGEEAYGSIVENGNSFESSRGEILKTKKYYIMPVHSPSFLERNPSAKKDTMISLLKIKEFLKKLQ